MKTLLVLRHGKSSWKNPNWDDHERPLNKRGRYDAPRMGQLLRDENLVPDLVLSSTAERASATALAVAETAGYTDEIDFRSELYHATVQICIDQLKQVSDMHERVMLVGHNPGLQELVATLSDQLQPFPTAALAHIWLPIGSWNKLSVGVSGVLKNLWRPREMEPDAG